MKKPLALISNDWHIEPTNTELIKSIIKDKIKLAIELKVTDIFVLGDIFHDRKSQRQIVLNTFSEILGMFEQAGLTPLFVTGNHDKSDYSSDASFLTPFNFKGNIIDNFYKIEGDDLILGLAPFFIEDVWMEKFKDFHTTINKPNKTKILFTHIAFQGSINNDGSEVNSTIKPSMFRDYELVLSGHYHNRQQIAPNVFHLPSLYQRNYGEDTEKGFTILYDDLSIDLFKSDFPEYKKVSIDIDTISKKDLESKLATYSKEVKEGSNVRFEFKGSEKKVKALKKDIFTSNGIDVKTKIKEVEETEIAFNDEVKKLDIDTINKRFEKFCEDEELDVSVGKKYLEKILQ